MHVPFCKTQSHFCAFYLRGYRDTSGQAFLESLAREIRLHAELRSLHGCRLDTVYFGGGTPTTLSPGSLSHVLTLVERYFGIQDRGEVTVEAHPDTVTESGLRSLVQAGFNRISFGVQSMDNKELLHVGRRSVSESVRTVVAAARRAGFMNINLDLIYGLPGQTDESWLSTLDQAFALEPTHLSCYALTVEEGTRLDVDLRHGDTAGPDAELQNAMGDEACRRLALAGFARYQLSNYCRPGYACRHNMLYWEGNEYLGLGPSAQSYLGGRRFGNVADLKTYRDALDAGRLPVAESEFLSPMQREQEAIVFGLRLTGGVELGIIRTGLWGGALDWSWEQGLKRLTREGLLKGEASCMKLTALGRRFADSVAVELL
ncbi:MAG: radical SAM family heme chaperone HemW [Nitrospirota bacterium]|nr:radical SAM family heme chaperone HemW [Nitrospirota bacterium]